MLPQGRFYTQGVAGYFNEEGLEAFQSIPSFRGSDVIMASFPKCGTSWLHSILFCLLRMDDRGEFPAPLEELAGARGQIYPDGVPVSLRGAGDEAPHPGPQPRRGSIEALLEQPNPRLFTSHIRANQLPVALRENGRLVMIARNPKDALVSAWFFQQMLNETGFFPERNDTGVERGLEGAFEDYLESIPESEIPRGAYGDYWKYYRDMLGLAEQLGPERATWTFYETLQTDFEAEVVRIADFLDVPLSPAKLEKLADFVAFDKAKERGSMTTRMGVTNDHVNHLTPKHWERMDAMFAEKMGDLDAFAPLRPYMTPAVQLQEDLDERMEVLSDDEGWNDDDEGWPRHDPIRPQDLWTTTGRKQYQDEHADAVNLGGYGGLGMQIPMRARLEAEKLAENKHLPGGYGGLAMQLPTKVQLKALELSEAMGLSDGAAGCEGVAIPSTVPGIGICLNDHECHGAKYAKPPQWGQGGDGVTAGRRRRGSRTA